MESPDAWVLIELSMGDKKSPRVLCGWHGGYLGSDAWRLSSDIKQLDLEEASNSYIVTTNSDNKYKLQRESQGLTSLTASILSQLEVVATKDGGSIRKLSPEEFITC